MAEPPAAEPDAKTDRKSRKRKPWWRRKRWWTLAVLVGLLVWLDGPGWRWIGGMVAGKVLESRGLDGALELEGRLSGGRIAVRDLRIEGEEGIHVVGLDSLVVEYKLGRVVKGEVERVAADGVHVEIDLAEFPPSEEKPEEEESEPLDLPQLLANLRQRLVPMGIELQDISATIRDDEALVVKLEPTDFLHDPGADEFRLDLGAVEFGPGVRLAAQQSVLAWREGELALDRLGVTPEVGIEELVLDYSDPDQLAASTGIRLDRARLALEGTMERARLRLVEGRPAVEELAQLVLLPLPLEATLTELDLEARDFLDGLGALAADARLALAEVDYDGWSAPRLALDATLDGETLALELDGEALESPLAIDAELQLDRGDGLNPRSGTARVELAALGEALDGVIARTKADAPPPEPAEDEGEEPETDEDDGEDAEPPPPPPAAPKSTLALDVALDFPDGWNPAAEGTLAIDAAEEETPDLELGFDWDPVGEVQARLETVGLVLEGSFDTSAMSYAGDVALDGFVPRRMRPWAAPFGAEIPAGIEADLTWNGEGRLERGEHEGKLELVRLEWAMDAEGEPIQAFASADYAWPERVHLSDLNVQRGAKKIEARVTLEDDFLDLERLAWTDQGTRFFTGEGRIPVPEDPTDWRALLAEEREIRLDLETPELELGELHAFLPESVRFTEAARGELDLDLSGTPAAPVLDARLAVSSFGLQSQPDIPSIDANLELTGRENTTKLDGRILTEGFPPAVIEAVTSWAPSQWAEDPETISEAPLDARLKVDDLNLGLFAKFVDGVRTLEGLANIDVEIGGSVAEPEPQGRVRVDGVEFAMEDDTIPPLKRGTIDLRADPERVAIETLNVELAGGTIDLGGGIELAEWQPARLDLTLNADALPLKRDDSMIVRGDLDLALRGPWEDASLSGTLGIVDSLFYKDIELLPIGEPFNQPSEPSLPKVDAAPPKSVLEAIPEPFRNWNLDLGIETKNPFLVRGNLAAGRATVDIDIDGEVGAPRPSGAVVIEELTARLPFSTLTIEGGRVVMNPRRPFDPTLDIRGTSTIRPYEVRLFVYGPISDAKVLATSSPPLPESEVMTLLATGTTTRGFEDPEAATARAAQLFIEEARRGRIGELSFMKPVFSVLDRVDFQVGAQDPYTSERYNAAAVNLSDSWVLEAGFDDEGDTRTTLTYLLRFK